MTPISILRYFVLLKRGTNLSSALPLLSDRGKIHPEVKHGKGCIFRGGFGPGEATFAIG
jgi:hypothetical protein